MTATLHIPWFDPGDYVWHAHGWGDGYLGSVSDATRMTRSQAKARYLHESNELWTEVGCWKRWIWIYSLQDCWDRGGVSPAWHDEWMDEHGVRCTLIGGETRYTDRETGKPVDPPQVPEAPPEGWEPWEEASGWEFVPRSDPRAQPAWICGHRADGPPPKPRGLES